MPGSIVLLGGEPGIGKSTLILQTVLGLKEKVLYVSGEESPHQVKMRAERLEENALPSEGNGGSRGGRTFCCSARLPLKVFSRTSRRPSHKLLSSTPSRP